MQINAETKIIRFSELEKNLDALSGFFALHSTNSGNIIPANGPLNTMIKNEGIVVAAKKTSISVPAPNLAAITILLKKPNAIPIALITVMINVDFPSFDN
jgi:hypothetical protein